MLLWTPAASPISSTSVDRLASFNFCNPFDHVLPLADGAIEIKDRKFLWGLYTELLSGGLIKAILFLQEHTMRQITKDSTNVSVELFIVDATTGLPELGVTYAEAGIDLNYRRDGAAVVSITEADLAALTTAHTDGGFKEVANGRYRLDLPDAAFATGVSQVTIGGTITGMIVVPVTVELLDAHGLTAATIADAVWDEVQTGHTTAGTFGKYLDDEITDITGSDATLAKQNAIIAAITPVVQVVTSQPDESSINLVRGDAYDGTSNAALAWTVSKSVNGETINFTIRDIHSDSIVFSTADSGVTATGTTTTASVSIDSVNTALLSPGNYKFDVEVEFSATSKWTIARGSVNVKEDQSR